jgi:hypothetical protein
LSKPFNTPSVLIPFSFQPIEAKLAAVLKLTDVPFRFYNANVATLRMSLLAGGQYVLIHSWNCRECHPLCNSSGFSGICANFYPHLVAWLCQHPHHEQAAHVQTMISLFENVIADNVRSLACPSAYL